MATPAFQRARRPEQKELRRAEILAAARALAIEHGVRTVSLGDIAGQVGLAKSNVVRYFGTREEIFLRVAADEWRAWADDLARHLGRRRASTARVAAALARSLDERPLLCDLMGQSAGILEHNVSVGAAREFKMTTLAVIDQLGAAVAHALHRSDGAGAELVAATAVFAGALWPIAHPAPVLQELFAAEPELARGCVPFVPTLERLVAALAEGMAAPARSER